MSLLLRRGRVIDPGRSIDQKADVLIEEGRITRIERGIQPPAGARVIELGERWVAPGLIDLHVHLREPGHEYKEDVASGTRAAAAGGFTAVCCMPNTSPVNDTRAVTELIRARATEVGVVRVYPVGAMSQGLKGESLAEIGEMKEAGIVAVTDDGKCLMNAELMRRAMEYARTFDLPVMQHCEDGNLARAAAAHEGVASTRAGLPGQPAAAESAILARDLELCAMTGARYHAAHLSAATSVRLVREAKRRGLPVSAEVTPHHLTLTDEAILGYDTNTRVNPPLRSAADREALWEGLGDGTIDCIATDHAPHSPVEKELEYEYASPGIIGLETALALGLKLVQGGSLKLERLLHAMTAAPARAFGLPGGSLTPGGPADLVVIDPERSFTVTPAKLCSKSRNTPFAGWDLRGKAVLTVCGGRVVHDEIEA
jgi:dihydroorotase